MSRQTRTQRKRNQPASRPANSLLCPALARILILVDWPTDQRAAYSLVRLVADAVAVSLPLPSCHKLLHNLSVTRSPTNERTNERTFSPCRSLASGYRVYRQLRAAFPSLDVTTEGSSRRHGIQGWMKYLEILFCFCLARKMQRHCVHRSRLPGNVEFTNYSAATDRYAVAYTRKTFTPLLYKVINGQSFDTCIEREREREDAQSKVIFQLHIQMFI